MSSTVVMEPWEAFTDKTMRWPNVQVRLLMKVEPLEIELEGSGNNAFKVPPYRSTTKGMKKNKDEFVNPKTWPFV